MLHERTRLLLIARLCPAASGGIPFDGDHREGRETPIAYIRCAVAGNCFVLPPEGGKHCYDGIARPSCDQLVCQGAGGFVITGNNQMTLALKEPSSRGRMRRAMHRRATHRCQRPPQPGSRERKHTDIRFDAPRNRGEHAAKGCA